MEDKIREVAYRLWEEDGCPHGKDDEHWTKAELIITETTLTRSKSKKKAPAKKKVAAKKRVIVAKKKAPTAKKGIATKKVSIKKKKQFFLNFPLNNISRKIEYITIFQKMIPQL